MTLDFPVIGTVKRKNGDVVPLLDIPMMSDEEWQRSSEELAREHFREWYGREAVSTEEAFEGQKAYVGEHWTLL